MRFYFFLLLLLPCSCSAQSNQQNVNTSNSNSASIRTESTLPDELYGKRVIKLTDEESAKIKTIYEEMSANNDVSQAAQKRFKTAIDLYETQSTTDKVYPSAENKRLAELASKDSSACLKEQSTVLSRNFELRTDWLRLSDELLKKYNVSIEEYYVDADRYAIMPGYSKPQKK